MAHGCATKYASTCNGKTCCTLTYKLYGIQNIIEYASPIGLGFHNWWEKKPPSNEKRALHLTNSFMNSKGKKYRTQTRGASNKWIGSDVYEHLEDNESATGTRSSDGSASNKIGQLICVKNRLKISSCCIHINSVEFQHIYLS
jgi:hypothetical protein